MFWVVKNIFGNVRNYHKASSTLLNLKNCHEISGISGNFMKCYEISGRLKTASPPPPFSLTWDLPDRFPNYWGNFTETPSNFSVAERAGILLEMCKCFNLFKFLFERTRKCIFFIIARFEGFIWSQRKGLNYFIQFTISFEEFC